ncbi:MAG TPA: twin-arginine translocation signal domain-containing protein [Acidimicrobiales bacterium]|nr:twin-arginine translocation signal domain-containing protein [Acidimicrobiales bacterium]
MEQVDRRTFIKQASTAVGVAGAAAAMPGLPRILSTGGALVAAPSHTPGMDAGTKLDDPIVAHVANLQTGEIHLFFGTHKVTRHDRGLAAQLYRATKK